MANKVTEERVKAVRLAIADIKARWEREHGDEPSTIQLGEWFGVSQQNMSAFKKDPVVGEKLADGVAAHLGTTVDGLVRQYLHQEVGEVRAGDLPGWREAVATAKRDAGTLGSEFLWDAAENVILPVAPRQATPGLVHDIAYLLAKHTRASGFVRRVK